MKITLPDGRIAELPDGMSPQDMADALNAIPPVEGPSLLSEIGTQAKKVGASLASGAGETVGGVLQLPGVISDFLAKNKPKDGGLVARAFDKPLTTGMGGFGKTVSDYWSGVDKTQGMEDGLPKSFVKGVGGALVTPIPVPAAAAAQAGRVAGANLLSGGVGAVGADLGQRFAPEGMKTGGAIAGGLVGGGLTGWLAGPKQSVARADIRRELEGVPPQQWAEARGNVDLFNNTGSTTATLADAFPGKPRITALANRASNMKGGEELAQRLSGRENDLSNLGEEFLRRLGPEVDANTVANQAGGAATSRLKHVKDRISNEVGRKLAGIQVPPEQVFDIYTSLKQFAGNAEREGVVKSFDAVADALLNPQGKPITNLQELSYAIRDLRTGLKNPLVTPPGTEILKEQAISAADRALAARFPAYKAAMADFAAETTNIRMPLKQGPIGSLADKNPLTAGQTPVSRLEGLISGNSPDTIRRTVSTLGSQLLTDGNPVDPRALARALAQQKLALGSTDPGKTVRGIQGGLRDRQMSALIKAGGTDPQTAMAPLRAADQLQNLSPANSVGGFPEMRSAQAAIRPFRTIDMMMTGRTERLTQQEISRLLANPTPAGLAQLQEIAMFDPNVRRQLTLIAAIRPGLFGGNSQEQK